MATTNEAEQNRPAGPAPETKPNLAEEAGSPVKDPSDWTTGAEPITGAQKSYLHTLATEAGETIDDDLTKAGASEKIEELQAKTGRGK